MARFELSEIQANHILDMPLRRLTALETEKLREEHEELMQTIAALNAILGSDRKLREVVATELAEIRDKYANERRSRIIPDEGDMSLEDLIADEELVVTITAAGYVKSVLAKSYRTQGRGGPWCAWPAAAGRRRDHPCAPHDGPRVSPVLLQPRQGLSHQSSPVAAQGPDGEGCPRPVGAGDGPRRTGGGHHRHQGLRDVALPRRVHPQRPREEDPVLGLRLPQLGARRNLAPGRRRGRRRARLDR